MTSPLAAARTCFVGDHLVLGMRAQRSRYSALACARHHIHYVGYVLGDLHGRVCQQVGGRDVCARSNELLLIGCAASVQVVLLSIIMELLDQVHFHFILPHNLHEMCCQCCAQVNGGFLVRRFLSRERSLGGTEPAPLPVPAPDAESSSSDS